MPPLSHCVCACDVDSGTIIASVRARLKYRDFVLWLEVFRHREEVKKNNQQKAKERSNKSKWVHRILEKEYQTIKKKPQKPENRKTNATKCWRARETGTKKSESDSYISKKNGARWSNRKKKKKTHRAQWNDIKRREQRVLWPYGFQTSLECVLKTLLHHRRQFMIAHISIKRESRNAIIMRELSENTVF